MPFDMEDWFMVLGFEKGDKAERFIMSMLSDYVCSLLLKDRSCNAEGALREFIDRH
jgi:hypothetical protein